MSTEQLLPGAARRAGGVIYRDVLYEQYAVAVELDGRAAYSGDQRWLDIQRDNAAAADGIVANVSNTQLNEKRRRTWPYCSSRLSATGHRQPLAERTRPARPRGSAWRTGSRRSRRRRLAGLVSAADRDDFRARRLCVRPQFSARGGIRRIAQAGQSLSRRAARDRRGRHDHAQDRARTRSRWPPCRRCAGFCARRNGAA